MADDECPRYHTSVVAWAAIHFGDAGYTYNLEGWDERYKPNADFWISREDHNDTRILKPLTPGAELWLMLNVKV